MLVVAVILCGGKVDAETIHFERSDINGPRLAPVKIKSGVGLGNAIIDDTNNPETFYMLANMCDLKADKITGDAGGEFFPCVRAVAQESRRTLPLETVDTEKFFLPDVIVHG